MIDGKGVIDGEIDEALERRVLVAPPVRPASLLRIAETLRPSLCPVRPLPSTRALSIALVLICAAVGLAGAARAGLMGFERMGLPERLMIFSTLGVLAWIAARSLVCEWIPGSRRGLAPSTLLALLTAGLLGVFALAFRDYHTTRFIQAGVACLIAGVAHAIPAGLLCFGVLRRGFALNPVSAGLTAGSVGGLAGVTMLELHCPLFEAPHVLVWHTAVVPVSAAIGVAAGLLWRSAAERSRATARDMNNG